MILHLDDVQTLQKHPPPELKTKQSVDTPLLPNKILEVLSTFFATVYLDLQCLTSQSKSFIIH